MRTTLTFVFKVVNPHFARSELCLNKAVAA